MAHKAWQEVARTAQEHRDASLAQVAPALPNVPAELPLDVTQLPKALLSRAELDMTETAAEELVASLAAGRVSSLDVTLAFLHRAGLAQKLSNCITELLPTRALARAKHLDAYLAEHKRPIGPLHGLPISVKEHIGMRDLGLNAGFIAWYDETAPADAPILQILWNAGCVFYARTTQPQTLMHLETSSNLYGVTVNPFNRNLTCGGSSGGEGALLGLRGSCLGIGTDIGGSIRSPAANCGVYGFRPSNHRLPVEGCKATMLNQEQIVAVIGPLATSLPALSLFMKTVIAAEPWLVEPSLVPLPWRDGESHLGVTRSGKKRLKVGVLWHDGVVKPHPPVTWALEEVVAKLRGVEEIEVVDWMPYRHDEAWEIIASLYFCDGAKEERDAIEASGEPWRPLSEFIIKENPHVKHRSVEDVWYWTGRREAYRRAYAKQWNETATNTVDEGQPGYSEGMVDVILCPVGPGVAPEIDHARYWGYTAQWNLLDYPACVFPVGKVDKESDAFQVERDYTVMNAQDETNHKAYEPAKYHGAPISLQLVGRRYQDEKVLEALAYIKDQIGLPFATYT